MATWVTRVSLFGVAVLALVRAFQTPLAATTVVVPEIDGGSLSVGMAVLAGGVLMLRARLRAK
jgi:hypothetical protein